MTAYILTPEQHAQIVEALKDGIRAMNHHNIPLQTAPLHDALAMLKAMKPSTPTACIYKGNQYMRHEFMNDKIPEGSTPLYAKEQQ